MAWGGPGTGGYGARGGGARQARAELGADEAVPGDAARADVEKQDDQGPDQERAPDRRAGFAGLHAGAIEEFGLGGRGQVEDAAAGFLGDLLEELDVGAEA